MILTLLIVKLLLEIIVLLFLFFRKKDIFYPGIYFILRSSILTGTIYGFFLLQNPNLYRFSLLLKSGFEEAFCKALVLSIIGEIFYIFGILSCKKAGIIFVKEKSLEKFELKIKLLFLLSILIMFTFFYKVGGLAYYLNNLGKRQILSAGLGFLDYPFIITLVVSYYSFYYIKEKKSKVILLLLIVFMIGTITLFGGRNAILKSIIFTLAIFNFSLKKLEIKNLIKIKGLFFIAFIIFLFLLLPAVRNGKLYSNLKTDGIKTITTIIKNSSIRVLTASNSLDREIYIFDYYKNTEDRWYGRSFLDTIPSLIPRKLYPNKPSMDEGRYLASNALNKSFKPSIPSDLLPAKYGYPPGNMVMYINFGLLGWIFANYFTGFIIMRFYRKVIQNRSVIQILIYCIIFMNFTFSNLNLGTVIKNIIEIFIIVKCFFGIKIFKKNIIM